MATIESGNHAYRHGTEGRESKEAGNTDVTGRPADAAQAGLALLDAQTANPAEDKKKAAEAAAALKKSFSEAEQSKEPKIYRAVDKSGTERFLAIGDVKSSELKAKAVEYAKAHGVHVQVQASAASYYVDGAGEHITTWWDDAKRLRLPAFSFSASDLKEFAAADATANSAEKSADTKSQSALEREIRKAIESNSIEPEEARRILKELLGEATKITAEARTAWQALGAELPKDLQRAMKFADRDVDGKIAREGKTGKTVGELQKIAKQK